MTTAYSAILTSHLATIRLPSKSHVQQQLKLKSYSFCLAQTSHAYKKYHEETYANDLKKSVLNKSELALEIPYDILNRFPCTTNLKNDVIPIQDYCSDKTVILESIHNTNFLFQREQPCKIHTFSKRYFSCSVSLLASKKFKFTRLINAYLLKFHSNGIIKKYQQEWLPSATFSEEKKLRKIAIVNFGHIKHLLVLYLSVIMVSLTILLIELIVYRRMNDTES